MYFNYLLITLFLLSCANKSTEDLSKSPAHKTKLNVLIVTHLENDLNEVENFSSWMPNFNITVYDGGLGLSHAKLDSQDVVLYFTNNVLNTVALGDSLFEYVNKGGNLVLGTFFSYHSYTIDFGKLSTILPAEVADRYAYEGMDTLIVNSDNTFFNGIDTLISFYGGGDFVLNENAIEIGRWNNGDLLASYIEPKGRVMLLSSFPTEPHYSSFLSDDSLLLRNFYRLWANAIRFAHSKETLVSDLN